MTPSSFPGGTSLSRLSVYHDQCADGLAGGTPHLHTASTEAYIVIGGTGALQTLDLSGFRETALQAGSTVWFTPGTIHRAINHGDLEVVVLMQNAGLPEAGDAVMTFPLDVVADPDRYRAAAAPPSKTLPNDGTETAVQRRRELAVAGFHHLSDSIQRGDQAPLRAFYNAAVALVRPAVGGWRRTWEETVVGQTRQTAELLDALERGDGSHLHRAQVLESPPSPDRRWGMCGRLTVHDVSHPH